MPLMGGLGNQMFQYAAAYCVAKRNNAKLYVHDMKLNTHNKKGHNYIKELFLDASESLIPPVWLDEFQQGGHSQYHPWDPSAVKLPCRMSGYFQYIPALHSCLPELVEKFRAALCVGPSTDNVFLHIRRGDYLDYSDIHHLQTPDYYLLSYLRLTQARGDTPKKVLVFSDDIPWCKEKEQEWLRSIPNLEFYENDDEIESLREMAQCKGGAIIANSTFSLWAAYLCKTSYVYYPKLWIQGFSIESIVPRLWACI
jgi:hypothetical protein